MKSQGKAIVACIANRGGEVGMACLLQGEMKLSLCQIIDTTVGSRHVRAQIHRFEPSTAILLETSHADMDCLNRSVKDACESFDCAMVYVKRRCFDDTRGFELISEFRALPCLKNCDLSPSNYLAVGASGAILRWIQDSGNEAPIKLAPHSIAVTFESPGAFCQLDANTALALAVVGDKQECHARWNLHQSISAFMKTQSGRRLLRASLLQCLVDRPTILERQAAIGELVALPDVQAGIQAFLADIPSGIHQCLPLLAQLPSSNGAGRAASPNKVVQAVLNVRQMLIGVQTPAAILQPCNSLLLTGVHAALVRPELQQLLETINTIVADNWEPGQVLNDIKMCYCIKPDINKFLDAARDRFNQLTEDLQSQKESFENGSAGLPPARLAYTRNHGWHLVFKLIDFGKRAGGAPAQKRQRAGAASSVSVMGAAPNLLLAQDVSVVNLGSSAGQEIALPEGHWKLATNKKSCLCMTNELAEWNANIKRAADDCCVLASQILASLQVDVEKHRNDLVQALDSISLLDFLSGYVAYMHSKQETASFCRPLLSRHPGLLHITQGFHPMHGSKDPLTCQKIVLRSNNATLSKFQSFNLLLGANSSGKSTYIAQVSLLCILAQAGLWVPAKDMLICPFRSIVSHIAVQKQSHGSTSSMLLEAESISYLLKQVEQSEGPSLALVDELATSTSSVDGMAIAWAVAEKLIQLEASTVLATHYVELDRLPSTYSTARTSHMECVDQGSYYRHTYECVSGGCTQAAYGVCLAEKAGIPKGVVQHARLLAEKIKKHELSCFPADRRTVAQAQVMERLHHMLIQHNFKTHGTNHDSAGEEWKEVAKLLEEVEASFHHSTALEP